MSYYAKKREPIQAAQWSGEMSPEMAAVLGPRAVHVNIGSDRTLEFAGSRGPGRFACVGDWIYSTSGEDLSVISDEQFRSSYEEVDEAGQSLPRESDALKWSALVRHVAACPIGFVDGRSIMHRSTTDADIVAWLVRLHELAQGSRFEHDDQVGARYQAASAVTAGRRVCIKLSLDEADLVGAAVCRDRDRVLDERGDRKGPRLLTEHEQAVVPVHQEILRKIEEALTSPSSHALNAVIVAAIGSNQSPSDHLLGEVRSFCDDLPLGHLRAAIDVHRSNCRQDHCPVLTAMVASAEARDQEKLT